MGDAYRQNSKATGPELEARSANATNKNRDAEAGIRGLEYPPRCSLSVWEMPKG